MAGIINSVITVLCLCQCIALSTAEDVIVADNTTLQKYLCPPKGEIIPHNTTLVLSKPVYWIHNEHGFYCLVENTSNITILPSQDNRLKHATVVCEYWVSIGFFNITNLTIKSVIFDTCIASITTDAVRYINDSSQFLYYLPGGGVQVPKFSLIFNHCYNLKLINISIENPGELFQSYTIVDFIGVNLLGQSTIESWMLNSEFKMLVYFTDTNLTDTDNSLKSNLMSITTNAIPSSSELDEDEIDILDILHKRQPRMLIEQMFSDFGLYLMQQRFDIDIDLNIVPHNNSDPDDVPMSAMIVFIDHVTSSHVSMQGHLYQSCLDNNYRLPALNFTVLAIFYETPSFNGNVTASETPLLIKNTSFSKLHYFNKHCRRTAMLQIVNFPGQLSHQVVLENVSWCRNDLTYYYLPMKYSLSPFHAKNWLYDYESAENLNGQLLIRFNNVIMHHNTLDDVQKSSNCLLCLENIKEAVIEGTSSFYENAGGTVISVLSSNLSISGNLTVKNGYAVEGGGIYLDSASVLLLKEPLHAVFRNNTADRGSAIYAPVHDSKTLSAIQVVPNRPYSLENITKIRIKFHFHNNSDNNKIVRSLYAPHFCFLGRQQSTYILFKPTTWDTERMQYAYTTMIDAILHPLDEIDKFMSLSNGVCLMMSYFATKRCKYIDMIYRNSTTCTTKALFEISTYPGDIAFTILNALKSQYLYEIGYCWQVSFQKYKYKMYKDWKIKENNDLSFVINYNKNVLEAQQIKLLMSVTSTEVDIISIPLAGVTMVSRCPFGFNLTDSGSCDCVQPLLDHHYTCDIAYRNLTSRKGYWTSLDQSSPGNIYDTILFNDHCPPTSCLDGMSNFTLNTSLIYTSCLGNRIGVLCGKCRDTYSLAFGSDTCRSDCTHLYLLTVPVYAIVGLVLVLILFLLRLTVASGTVNGVIFYANALELVMNDITYKYSSRILTVIRFVISLLNMNLGFPLCLYNGMTAFTKVGLQFVFPVYLWCIVIGFIVISKYSIKVSNIISGSSVQVLSTLFYFSFSKVLQTVITIVSSSSINVLPYDDENYYNSSTRLVWFYNGDNYGHGIHGVLLLLAAIFSLAFLLPYMVLVTFSYCFVRFSFINRFKPFVDAYGGPFKDKWRFWFGLRLWVTAILFSVSGALEGRNTDTMFIFNIVLVLILILLQAAVRPFKRAFIELVDIFFMLNYWIIIVVYLSVRAIFLGTYLFLTLLAITVLFLILLYQTCNSRLLQKHRNRFICLKEHEYQPINNAGNRDEGDSDVDLYRAAEEREVDA